MKTHRTTRAAVLALALAVALTGAPAAAQSDAAAWARVDELVQQAIRDHKLPGAVVLVGQGDACCCGRRSARGRSIRSRKP